MGVEAYAGRVAEFVVSAVRIETAACEQVPVVDGLGFIFSPDVQDALFLLVLADLVIRVLVGVFLVRTDVDHLLGGQVVERVHRGVAEEQGTVHIDSFHIFVQDRGAALRNLDARHLGQDVDGHLSLVDLDGGCTEDDGVFIDRDGRDGFFLDGGVEFVSLRLEIGDDLVFAGRDIHRMPLFGISDHRETDLCRAGRNVEDAETPALRYGGEKGVFLGGHDNDDRSRTGNFLVIFIFRQEPHTA